MAAKKNSKKPVPAKKVSAKSGQVKKSVARKESAVKKTAQKKVSAPKKVAQKKQSKKTARSSATAPKKTATAALKKAVVKKTAPKNVDVKAVTSKAVRKATPKATPVKSLAPASVKPVPPPVKATVAARPQPAENQRMSPEDLAYFEKLLLEKRAKLVEELNVIEESNLFRSQNEQGGELSGYTNHLADAASDYTTLETNFELAEREGKYLVYIEEALERVRKGTYGVCKVCGCLIPRARLEAVPTATKCVDCKAETKKREALEQQMELARMAENRRN